MPGAFWPTIQTKRRGLEPAHIDALRNANATEITWIVEADGARGLRIKAPGPTEPAIPPCADVVAVVACLDALGRPLDDRTAHRADRIAALTGCMPGAVITPHAADSNRDGRIDIFELTRVIELYNFMNGSFRTGSYHAAVGTEDGVAPGVGVNQADRPPSL